MKIMVHNARQKLLGNFYGKRFPNIILGVGIKQHNTLFEKMSIMDGEWRSNCFWC